MAPAAKSAKADVYVAKVNAVVETEDGQVFHLAAGKTRLRADHPVVKMKGSANVVEPVDTHLSYDPKTPPGSGEVGE